MRFIMIDPFAEKVTDNKTPFPMEGDLFRNQLGCQWYERRELFEGVDIWIDEEGLLDETGEQKYFTLRDGKSVLAGRGLICGCSKMGESIGLSERISIEMINNMVLFLGDQDGLEDAIRNRIVLRPASYIITGNKREKIWEWKPVPVIADA